MLNRLSSPIWIFTVATAFRFDGPVIERISISYENGKDNFYNVAFDLAPVQDEVVWEGVLIKESMWAYAREVSAKEQYRLCYNDINNKNKDSLAAAAPAYSQEVHDRFSEQKQNALFVKSLADYVASADDQEWHDILDQVVEYD